MSYRMIRLIIVFVVMAIGGVIFLISSIKTKIELSKPVGILEEMTPEDFYDGRYVEGTIYELWDEFSYTEETKTTMGVTTSKRTTDHYYALPLETSFENNTWEDLKFVAIAIRDPSALNTANKMSQESLALYNGEGGLETTMHVKGKVTKLKNEYLQFLNEYMESENLDASQVCAYVIRYGNDGRNSTFGLLVAIGLTVVGFGGIAFIVIRKIMAGRAY